MTIPKETELQPVLILGAGINGCATARELVLNGVPVIVVDREDIASGATARSSRLIHGGLRYLEYGEYRLVRESLEERIRFIQSAPHLVFPLRLYIPLRRRWGGLFQSTVNFLGLSRWEWLRKISSVVTRRKDRGMWLVRMGLWFYDRFVHDGLFDSHTVHCTTDEDVPRVDPSIYRWFCAYSDARITYPERYVLECLKDARNVAELNGNRFEVLPYHRVKLQGSEVRIVRQCDGKEVKRFRPSLIVNATGAWGDLTLKELDLKERKLFGGTKGSHLVTHSSKLKAAIGDAGVYSEAPDGRMIFVLPFGDAVLIGTTDLRYRGRPENAVATEEEVEYLIEMANGLFPEVNLSKTDVELHYSGIRPLPRTDDSQTSAITREQNIHLTERDGLKIFTLIGGKLTTGRLFGEQVADCVFAELGIARNSNTRTRTLPGGTDFPRNLQERNSRWNELRKSYSLTENQVACLWNLFGTNTELLCDRSNVRADELLDGTQLPLGIVPSIIRSEWVTNLSDLVERRLMLLFDPKLGRKCLIQLAECLADAEKIDKDSIEEHVEETIARLGSLYCKKIP